MKYFSSVKTLLFLFLSFHFLLSSCISSTEGETNDTNNTNMMPSTPHSLSYLYVLFMQEQKSGIKVLDARDFSNIREINQYVIDQFEHNNAVVNSIFVYNNLLYATVSNEGLKIFDISNPYDLREIASYKNGSYFFDVFVSGDYAYVAAENSIEVLDVTSPQEPRHVSSYTGNFFGKVQVVNNNLYSSGGSNFYIFDISDPASPVLKGTYYLDFFLSFSVSGKYAYLTDSKEGFHVVDVSVPESPAKVNFCRLEPYTAYHSRNIFIHGEYAYVSNNIQGILAINILSSPFIQYSKSIEGYDAKYLYASENHIYATMASASASSLKIFEIPYLENEVGTYTFTDENIFVLKVFGQHLP